MSLLNIFDISGSALSAQSQRMNVSASNMANADSVTGPDGEPYRAKQVVFQVAAAPGQPTGGVRVAQVVDDPAPERLVYQPGNPLADAKGYVRMPNVDVVGGNGQHHLRLPQLPGQRRGAQHHQVNDDENPDAGSVTGGSYGYRRNH
jgi:flagellar basal-body rod protein FlgC